MRIALLTGAHPQRSKGGPIVRLPAGKWSIEGEGVVNTRLHLLIGISEMPNELGEYEFEGPVDVAVAFAERGNESHVSVFARKVA
jgi:hypothetical protein